MNTEQLLLISR